MVCPLGARLLLPFPRLALSRLASVPLRLRLLLLFLEVPIFCARLESTLAPLTSTLTRPPLPRLLALAARFLSVGLTVSTHTLATRAGVAFR